MWSIVVGICTLLGGAASAVVLYQFVKERRKYGYFYLMQKATGHYLDGSQGNVYPHVPNGKKYQRLRAIQVTPNVIKLKHVQSKRLLDASPDGGAYLLKDNGGLYQQWELVKVPGQEFIKLKQLATNLLLDAGSGKVYIGEDNGGDYQLWKVVRRNNEI